MKPDKPKLTRSEVSRLGGESTSKRKQKAARENGKLGGRPPKPDAEPKRRARYEKQKSGG